MPTQKPPTDEIGVGLQGMGITQWNSFQDDNEPVLELAWPNSVRTYALMRRDAQIASLEESVLLPILSRRWRLNPNGADPKVVDFFSQDLSIPIMGEKDDIERGRTRGRFRLRDHLRMAMTYRSYGHAYFEQVVEPGADGLWHLKKLAPRFQSSIQEIKQAGDGGLEYIRQYAGKPDAIGKYLITPGTVSKPIPVERLVAYIHRQEGDWYGQSVLRPLYKHFLRKDRLLRVDAVKHERNGMGVPIVEAPPNATKDQLIQAQILTEKFRSGEKAGGTLPAGFKLRLVGVEGSIPDTLASLRYDDEQMSRVYLNMLMQLGTTSTGNRALGETFSDVFAMALDAICEDLISVFNEHVIEDLVDWNWGPDAACPLLTYDDTQEKELLISDLVDLINAKVVSVDEDLEDWIRADYELPERDEKSTRTTTENDEPEVEPDEDDVEEDEETEAPDDKTKNRANRLAFVDDALFGDLSPLSNVQNREPNETEIAAGTDFEALEQAIESATAYLVSQWSAIVRPAQIESLALQIEAAAGDLVSLALISAPVLGDDILATELQRVVSQASAHAVAEAATQGVTISPLSAEGFADAINQRSTAIATVMAKSISEAAGRHAINNSADDVTPADLAALTKTHLTSLTDAYPKKNLGAAVQAAYSESRFATLDQGDVKNYYSSELPDQRICKPCERVNNRKYKTLDEAKKDYGTGRFRACEGGDSCRGTLVAIYKTEVEPSK